MAHFVDGKIASIESCRLLQHFIVVRRIESSDLSGDDVTITYLAFSLVVVLGWQFNSFAWLLPEQVAKLIYPIDESHMAPLRLIHFLALAIGVSRLTLPDWRGPMKLLVVAMIRCGDNSLVIYCLGVLLAFLAHVILVEVSASFAMQLAVSIGGIVLMVIAATLWTWEARLDRRGPKLF